MEQLSQIIGRLFVSRNPGHTISMGKEVQVPEEIWEDIIHRLGQGSILKLLLTSKTFGTRAQTLLAPVIASELSSHGVLTVSSMESLQHRAKALMPFEHALRQASRTATEMHVSIEHSSKQEELSRLQEFLATCFPSV